MCLVKISTEWRVDIVHKRLRKIYLRSLRKMLFVEEKYIYMLMLFTHHSIKIINTAVSWNLRLELRGRILALSFYRQILPGIVESFSVQINKRWNFLEEWWYVLRVVLGEEIWMRCLIHVGSPFRNTYANHRQPKLAQWASVTICANVFTLCKWGNCKDLYNEK